MRRLALALVAIACVAFAGGCESASAMYVDGGVGRLIQILTPPGAQIGLRYGQSVDLRVRYELDDDAHELVRGQPVRFAIFEDPGGSTISRDSADTDDNGVATVTLTAGNQEKSFEVHASAAGAADVAFDVSTSMLNFVTLDVALTDPLPQPGTRSFIAALFDNAACSQLPATAVLSGSTRFVSAPPAASATLPFINLLSSTYAVVGRVESQGALVAYGCVDVNVALDPPGATLTIPIPLEAVSASVLGAFTLTTSLTSARDDRNDTRFASIDVLDRCPAHGAQLVLDALASLVTPSRATLIAAQRGAITPSVMGTSNVQCRPAQVGSAASLDAQLDTLFAATSDGAERAMLIADLDALLASGSLRSSMVFSPTTPHTSDPSTTWRYVATHSAQGVSFTLGSAMFTTDLTTLALPLLVADGIDVTQAGASLSIAAHELTLGIPMLWAQTFDQQSIAARLPTLTNDTWTGWLTAVVAATQHGGKTGCAAVEDLVCDVTGSSGCVGTIATPCTTAIANVGATLDGVFAGDQPVQLFGGCTVVDSDHDLVADSLTSGQFTAVGPTSGTLSFSGLRGM